MSDQEITSPLPLSRSDFLKLGAAGLVVACTGCTGLSGKPRIGLAQGGGAKSPSP